MGVLLTVFAGIFIGAMSSVLAYFLGTLIAKVIIAIRDKKGD